MVEHVNECKLWLSDNFSKLYCLLIVSLKLKAEGLHNWLHAVSMFKVPMLTKCYFVFQDIPTVQSTTQQQFWVCAPTEWWISMLQSQKPFHMPPRSQPECTDTQSILLYTKNTERAPSMSTHTHTNSRHHSQHNLHPHAEPSNGPHSHNQYPLIKPGLASGGGLSDLYAAAHPSSYSFLLCRVRCAVNEVERG